MILLERFGEILIHLCLNALFSVAKHCMGCERDDRSPLGAETPFILADLCSGFESSLDNVQHITNKN
jgi:hypothetical protein